MVDYAAPRALELSSIPRAAEPVAPRILEAPHRMLEAPPRMEVPWGVDPAWTPQDSVSSPGGFVMPPTVQGGSDWIEAGEVVRSPPVWRAGPLAPHTAGRPAGHAGGWGTPQGRGGGLTPRRTPAAAGVVMEEGFPSTTRPSF